MKHLILFLFLGSLSYSYCSAQVLESADIETVNNPRPPKQTLVTVTFIADDTCNVTIDYKDHGKFVKNKMVRLPLGNHRLFFESLETGKTVRDRSFRLTRDRVTGGTYSYPVTFK